MTFNYHSFYILFSVIIILRALCWLYDSNMNTQVTVVEIIMKKGKEGRGRLLQCRKESL